MTLHCTIQIPPALDNNRQDQVTTVQIYRTFLRHLNTLVTSHSPWPKVSLPMRHFPSTNRELQPQAPLRKRPLRPG